MEKILVINFGGQYDQLIVRRVRAEQVYAELVPYDKITLADVRDYRGIIFTGGPNSVNDPDAPHFTAEILALGIPILGICYGHQLLAQLAGGTIVSAASASEYGKTVLYTEGDCPLFRGVAEQSVCWMSHTDAVTELPQGFLRAAYTEQCPCAAMYDADRKLYGVQFHPEVMHTVYGKQILCNFLFAVCGCHADWRMTDFIERSVRKYRRELAGKRVLLGLSGGVDSAVAAVLLSRAIGENLVCVFVDHGLLRKNEGDLVEKTFRGRFGIELRRVQAEERFLQKLKGVTEPEQKRKIIGAEFVRVFEQTAREIGKTDVLAQGTIYPDVIESGKGDSAVIKSHHNVGGLPEQIGFSEIVEPLRELFKDEVRELGEKLGIPRELVYRQPFPGPGLAVRILGEIAKDKAELLREADAIFCEEIERAGIAGEMGQYFAVLTDMKSVGVMGDARTYGNIVALRAVTTDDFMTAEWSRIPYEVLERASSRIINEVKGVARVVYDITSKPPATVEWE